MSSAQAADKFLQDPAAFIAKTKAETVQLADVGKRSSAVAKALVGLRLLKKTLQAAKKPTMKDCVQMAFTVFHALFRDKIVDLTTTYPEGEKTESGDPFWSGHKKFPASAAYDANNDVHVAFMVSATNLFVPSLCPPHTPPTSLYQAFAPPIRQRLWPIMHLL